jgi:hypothetical protein
MTLFVIWCSVIVEIYTYVSDETSIFRVVWQLDIFSEKYAVSIFREIYLRNVPPKLLYIFTKLHCVTPHNILILRLPLYRVIQEELPPLTELISDDILSKKCNINLGPIHNIYRVTFVFGNALL